MERRGWGLVLAAAVTLALVSLASNVTTGQQSGEPNAVVVVRSTISQLANAGVVWGGLPILSGWLLRRRWSAAAAGIVASLTALLVHYGAGRLLGIFDPAIWAENQSWFVFAVLLGGPLGMVGATARRLDLLGLLARLAVPVGAILEPLVLGMFTQPEIIPSPGQVSSAVAGVILIAAGAGSAAIVVLRQRRRTPGAGFRSVGQRGGG